MKRIAIYQENVDPIYLLDDDDANIDEYTIELENMFSSRNVKRIETTSGIAFIRPSKLVSINVTEVDEKLEQNTNGNIVNTKPVEDIITDAD